MLQLPGAPALSDFRLGRMLAELRVQLPGLRRIDCFQRYFVDLESPLDEAATERLSRLLEVA